MTRTLLGLLLATLAWSDDGLIAISQKAKQAMSEKRFKEAADHYRQLTTALPRNAGLQLNLGLALYSAGDFRGAIAPLREATKLDSTLSTAHLVLGVANLKIGEPRNAVGPLRRALELQPNNATATLELADAYLITNQFDRAVEYFRKFSVLAPASPKAWYGLGTSYLRLSGREFENLEKLAPESGYRLALLARARLEQQQYEEAFSLYRQAIARTPALRGIHPSIAEIYRKIGREDWAKAEAAKEDGIAAPDCTTHPLECAFAAGRFEEVVRGSEKRDDPASLYWRSRAYLQLAIASFERLAQLPPSIEMHELLAQSYRVQGRHREAAEEWRKALRSAPGNERLGRELARALWLGREYAEARPLLERLVAGGNQPAEVHLQLGDIVQRLEKHEQAVPHLEIAVRKNPGLLPARAALGRAYLESGRPAEAIPHLEAALPGDEGGALLFQLSRALNMTGRTQEAAAVLQKYQQQVKARQAQASEKEPIGAP